MYIYIYSIYIYIICVFVHVALSTKTSIVIWLCGEALPTPQSPFPLSKPPPAFFVPGSKNKHSMSKEKSLSRHFSEADVKNKRQTRTKGNDRKQTGKQGNKENQGKTKDNFCKSSTR